MTDVDVVVVAFNSAPHLRHCIEPLVELEFARVVVVDNASTDDSLETIRDLDVDVVRNTTNLGFAAGCNAGWKIGTSPNVLFLNPDATMDERSLRRLIDVLEGDESVGAVAPRIQHPDGTLAYSIRRFPRLRSTYARAVFLHRVLPRAPWTDELVRDATSYRRRQSPEWVSGACILVRRSALERIGGWDESFFHYGEDVDLCRRLWEAGLEIRYEPEAVAVHVEGASAPPMWTLPQLAASRIAYARKHQSRVRAALEQVGVALNALTHLALSRGGLTQRTGHARSLRVALTSRPEGIAAPIRGRESERP